MSPLLVLLAALLIGIWLPSIAYAQSSSPDDTPITLEAYPSSGELPLPSPSMLDTAGSDYRIGRQDLLEITVFDVEELSQTVRVSDDGSITMPLLGRLVVAGLTKFELEKLIASRLEGRFVRNPQVTVFVKEFESKKVAVSGAVKKPGTYEMLGSKTLLELISMAGGLDKDVGKEIVVFRPGANETTTRLAVDMEQLIYKADPELNLRIVPGDIIYVPTIETVRIFVSGEVKNPDVYEIPRDQPVTVLKAITLAGGTTDRAAEKKIQVIRTDAEGQRVVLTVNLRAVKHGKEEDPILQKDDIVLVPETFF